tara:strand:+ start:354 stop:728 length:375 start_codon:yes stop_codon:yes gene_type:complete
MRKLLLALLLTLGVFTFSVAEHIEQTPDERPTYDFYWNQMPTVCAIKSEIERWLENNNFEPVSASFGRENGREDGEIVYAVIVYINDNYEMAAVVETPNDYEGCIVFRTFNMQLNRNLKPGSNT